MDNYTPNPFMTQPAHLPPLLLMFSFISSITFFIWSIFSFNCDTICEVVPFNWLPISAFSLSFWLCIRPPPSRSSCVYLLRLISLLNSWFWRVNSAIAVAIDCTWTNDVCMTGADWRSRWGLLEASLLPWWPGLVALNLVRTIQPFVTEKKNNCKIIFPTDGTN